MITVVTTVVMVKLGDPSLPVIHCLNISSTRLVRNQRAGRCINQNLQRFQLTALPKIHNRTTHRLDYSRCRFGCNQCLLTNCQAWCCDQNCLIPPRSIHATCQCCSVGQSQTYDLGRLNRIPFQRAVLRCDSGLLKVDRHRSLHQCRC